MSEYLGSAMYLGWIYPSGTITFHADARNFSWQPTVNYVDATAGQDTFEVLLPKFGTGQDISIPTLAQTSGTVLTTACAARTVGTIVYGPEGTVSGAPKYLIPAISSGLGWDSPFDDVTIVTASFRQSGEYAGTVW